MARQDQQTDERPIEVTPQQAKQARSGGRVMTVLVLSMTLAILILVGILGYFYANRSLHELPAPEQIQQPKN